MSFNSKINLKWNEYAKGSQNRAWRRSLLNTTMMVGFLILFLTWQTISAITLFPSAFYHIPPTIQNSSISLTASFFLAQLFAIRSNRISNYQLSSRVFSFWLICVLSSVVVQLLLRQEYGFWFTTLAVFGGSIILLGFSYLISHQNNQAIGVVGDHVLLPQELNQIGVMFIKLKSPEDLNDRVDLLLVDKEVLKEQIWSPFLSWCAANGVPIILSKDFIESRSGRVDLENFNLESAIGIPRSRKYLVIKYIVDLVLTLLLVIALAPLFVVVAILVKSTSQGPVLFCQDRVGLGGTTFTIYKFRSMRTESQKKSQKFASLNDARVTRLGRFLRKTRIDELPQLFNVLRGEMSLIGPRPEQVRIAMNLQKEIPAFYLRHSMRPGITGWAQVCCGYADDVESSRRKVSYDLFYIRHSSFFLDLDILIRTFRIILSGHGAR
jgi:exopolysaccharide biosynthesis polyprenyl glycosylphosphotransferase